MDEIGEELAAWGKVIRLRTRGRTSGDPVWTAIGFVERPDGKLLVAAGSDTADWALNLRAEPRCLVELEGTAHSCRAVELDGDARNAAVVALILKYGTPAERLGRGPAFSVERDPADG